MLKTKKDRPNTQTYLERGLIKVKLYQTVIVAWDSEKIHINSGHHDTAPIHRRMNQTSEEYSLGFHASSKKGQLVVTYKGVAYTEEDNFITIIRLGG